MNDAPLLKRWLMKRSRFPSLRATDEIQEDGRMPQAAVDIETPEAVNAGYPAINQSTADRHVFQPFTVQQDIHKNSTEAIRLPSHPRAVQNAIAARELSNQDAIDTEAAETVDRPPSTDEGIRPSKVYHPFSFPVLALLAPASTFGVLARLGLVALTTYDGECIFPLAYVQALGCFIMGIGLRLKEPLGQFYGPLYTALTTGFCGSLTTFSSWQFDIFQSWLNTGEFHHNGLRDFIDGIGKSLFTMTLSLGSLSFGYSFAAVLAQRLPMLSLPTRKVRYSLTAFAVLSYAAVFPAYFRLPASYRGQATAALLFAYPGTLTRYGLSIYLNPRIKALPLGTFTANSFATALLGTFHVLQGISRPLSPHACAILQGLIDGYCGCLSTVSTFATEVRDLKGWKAFRYALLSWIIGQALLLVILGPSFWAGSVRERIACTFQ